MDDADIFITTVQGGAQVRTGGDDTLVCAVNTDYQLSTALERVDVRTTVSSLVVKSDVLA